jgi:hypothetical protein
LDIQQHNILQNLNVKICSKWPAAAKHHTEDSFAHLCITTIDMVLERCNEMIALQLTSQCVMYVMHRRHKP